MTTQDGLAIEEIRDGPGMEAALDIRHRVFCVEQGVSKAEEFDGRDRECRHYLARLNGAPVGAARTRPLDGGAAKVERVAVLSEHRGRGIGRALMDRTVDDLVKAGLASVVVHAQCHAEPFYRSLGFVTEGGVFDEAGIPHVRMVRTLSPTT